MHELHQSRRKDEKCHSFKTLLCVPPLSPLWQSPAQDRTVTGSVPDPSPAPTLTHCITALSKPSVTGMSAPYCVQKVKLRRSDVSQIPLPALQQSPANEKCHCSHTSPCSCASSTCTHPFFFSFCFSLPNCN